MQHLLQCLHFAIPEQLFQQLLKIFPSPQLTVTKISGYRHIYLILPSRPQTQPELRHGQHVGGLGPPALQVAVLQVRRRHLQRLTDPLPGGESAPAVRRPGGRVRAAVDEDGAVERAHELHPVADDLA